MVISGYLFRGDESDLLVKLYLEMWNELNVQTSMQSIADSSRLLPPLNGSWQDHTIFDVLTENSAEIASRAEDLLVQHICTEVEGQMKAHFSSIPSYVLPWCK